MNILTFQHEPKQTADLFGRIGELACARATHKALGVCVTSEPGRHWLVAELAGSVVGFASIHVLADGHGGQLRHLYAIDGPHANQALGQLLRHAARLAKKLEITTLTSRDRTAAARFYAANGWRADGQIGQYTTYHWSLS